MIGGVEPLGTEQRHDMLEIVEDRYGRGTTLITSQIPVDKWHDLIGGPSPMPSSTASSTMPIVCSSAATAARRQNCRRLTAPHRLWTSKPSSRRSATRPTSIGTAGRLRLERVADINRNARPTSSEYAAQTNSSFARVEGRLVVGAFDGGKITSNAGALLLAATDRAVGLVDRFARCFTDRRSTALIEHAVTTLVGQRVFGIALGYEDVLDHDELRHDPMMAVRPRP